MPPTALKARTGLLTPPGVTRWARSNQSADEAADWAADGAAEGAALPGLEGSGTEEDTTPLSPAHHTGDEPARGTPLPQCLNCW
ncbi:hypothetical protein GCM10027596_20650 [Nocardioides korecus]